MLVFQNKCAGLCSVTLNSTLSNKMKNDNTDWVSMGDTLYKYRTMFPFIKYALLGDEDEEKRENDF